MDINKPSFCPDPKDLHIEELSTCNDEFTWQTNTSKNFSNVESFSPPENYERRNLNNVEERRKTLILAATTSNVPKQKPKIDNNSEIEYMEDIERVNVATEIEVGLLDCYGFSLIPNLTLGTYCLQTYDQNNGMEENGHQSSQLLFGKGTQTEVGFLHLYSLSPCSRLEHDDDYHQYKEEEKSKDDVQGLTGLALLASSHGVSPKISPKNSPRNSSKPDTPRLNIETIFDNQTELVAPTSKTKLSVEKYIINETKFMIDQTELVAPTPNPRLHVEKHIINESRLVIPSPRPRSILEKPLFNQPELVVYTINPLNTNESKTIVETKTSNAQSRIASQSGFSSNSLSTHKVPTNSSFVKDSCTNYFVSEDVDDTTLEAKMYNKSSLIISKPESKDEMKLKQRALENLSCKNDYFTFSPKTPRVGLMPNLDYKKQCLLKDGEEFHRANDGPSKNGNDGLGLECNERDCKEWFREKLWCFLFENLSRAVDELYFLCDLQGASEKMNEVILFLEEACQDFKELKSSIDRVAPTDSSNNDSKISTVENKNEIGINEKVCETMLVIESNEKKHIKNQEINEEKSKAIEGGKESEIEISKLHLQIKANENGIDKLIDKDIHKIAIDPNVPKSSNNLESKVDKNTKNNCQPLSLEVTQHPYQQYELENKNVDCKIGMIVNVNQPPFANQPQDFEYKASVIGYRVDEERQKMVGFVDNEMLKCKPNKKILCNSFTGRLMRPTKSSNIRSVANLKLKEKEKLKNNERHGTWVLATKYHRDDLKQKTNWIDALATPRRGPSRCQDFEKLQSAKALNLMKKENISSKKIPRKILFGEKYREEVDASKVYQDNCNVKLPIQNQEKMEYKLRDEKSKKSRMGHVQKKTTKTNIHEYDVCYVKQRLAERLKQGVDKRSNHLDEIKARVLLVSDVEKYNQPCIDSSFWKVDGLLNQQFPHKYKEIIGDVHDSHARLKGIDFFQKQATEKKIRNVGLKLANKKVEFREPPSGIEGVGIGSATTTGLAKSKIGKWMDEIRRVQFLKDMTLTTSIVLEISKCLEGKLSELHVARQLGLLDYIATSIPLRQDPIITLNLLQIQTKLLTLPANRSYFILCNLFPPLIPMLLSTLEIFCSFGNFHQDPNSFNEEIPESNDDQIKRIKELNILEEILEGLLNSTTSIIEHSCSDENQLSMQDDLVDLLVTWGLIHELQNFFIVFHWQQCNQVPIPNSIILGLKLLEALTGPKRKSLTTTHEEPINILVLKSSLKQNQSSNKKEEFSKGISTLETMNVDHNDDRINNPKEDKNKFSGGATRIVITQKTSSLVESTTFLIAAISETRLIGLPSLLIGIILEVDPTSKEHDKIPLPFNFIEAAILLLQVLNNLARLDLSLIQNKLALPDVCLEIYQLMSFFLTYCTTNWKTSNDEIAALLLETMMLIGYATLLHPKNQAMLRWGKNPTIIQKICNLPFLFYSDSKLTPILIGTLLAICYGSEMNHDVVQQQLSMEILLTFLKSSKTSLFQSFNSTCIPKVREEMRNYKEKKIIFDGKKIKDDNDQVSDNHPSTQRVSLPKTLFSPSKSMMAKEKLGMFAPTPSTPRGTRLGNMTCCTTIQNSSAGPPPTLCSRAIKSLDFNDEISNLIDGISVHDVPKKNVHLPKLLNKNVEVNDKPKIVVMDPLPIAFELRNRFPEGLWTYAEDFFPSSTWMGQLVKCL